MLVERDPSITTVVDGDAVILGHEASGKCYSLNGSAGAAWMAIETPRTIEQIGAVLVAEFAVDLDQCLAATRAMIGDWRARGLVCVRD
jgi:hypothetical protein